MGFEGMVSEGVLGVSVPIVPGMAQREALAQHPPKMGWAPWLSGDVFRWYRHVLRDTNPE